MYSITIRLLAFLALLAQSTAFGVEQECAVRIALLRIPFHENSGNTQPLTTDQRIFESNLSQLFLEKSVSFLDTEALVFAKGIEGATAKWIIQAGTIAPPTKADYPLSQISAERAWDFIVVSSDNNSSLTLQTCGAECQELEVTITYLVMSAKDGAIKWKISGTEKDEVTPIATTTHVLEKLTRRLASEVFSRVCAR
jgi:hypothetical protein